MKLFIVLISIYGAYFFSDPQKNLQTHNPPEMPFVLRKVIQDKTNNQTIYHYQDGDDLYLVRYTKKGRFANLEILKNRKKYFSIKRNKHDKVLYRLGKDESYKLFNKSNYKKLPKKLKLFLAYQEADHQDYQPQFGGGSSNFGSNNGIPDILGADQSAASDCTQTGTCSCGESSITVTCPCGSVISCAERTVTVCDYSDTGSPINCREITGCSGRCD